MKKILSIILLSVIVFSCQRVDQNPVNDRVIHIGGSNTELEMVKNLIVEFEKQQPREVSFVITGEGSNSGLNNLIEGNIQVANSSRFISEEEKETAKRRGIKPVQGIIARDAIAIIVNPRVGVDSLSIEQLQDIFMGKITNWSELGGLNTSIVIYGRDANSGTREFIKNRLLRGESDNHIITKATQNEIVNAVKMNLGGMGYVGIGAIRDTEGRPSNDIWAVNLYYPGYSAKSPYQLLAIEDGSYPLSRPLFQYYKNEPSGALKEFVSFILSEEGQAIVKKHGYFPINEMQQQINTENGI